MTEGSKAHMVWSRDIFTSSPICEETQETLEIEARRIFLGQLPENWRPDRPSGRHSEWSTLDAPPEPSVGPPEMLLLDDENESVVEEKDEPLFCERMFVQTREFTTRVGRPWDIRAVYEGGCSTKLDKRWKEYLVVARRRPKGQVKLYLYTSKFDPKMRRRVQRRITHGLEFKFTVTPAYGISIYQPLDVSIALWNRGSTKRPLVYIFISKSIWTTTQFVRLILESQGMNIGGPTTVHVGKELVVRIPSTMPDHSVIQESERRRSILDPLVSKLARTTWESVEALNPFPEKPKRLALAFGRPGVAYWLLDSHFPVVDDYLLLSFGLQLSLIPLSHPDPHEPWAIEGFFFPLASFGLKKRSTLRYAYSQEHLLFTCDASNAVPPSGIGESLEKKINPLEWTDSTAVVNEWSRNLRLIRDSDGVIDLTKVSGITEEDQTVIALEFGQTRLRFEFLSSPVRNLWSVRLRDIVDFWKDVRQRQTNRLVSIALKGGFPTAEDIPYSSAARVIAYSSFIYMKKHKFASFRHYLAILTADAHMLFYQRAEVRRFRQTTRGVVASSPYWELTECFDLGQSYVFTGLTAMNLLLDRDRQFNSQNPGVRSLPRSYADGWRSDDTEVDRCFILTVNKKSVFWKFGMRSHTRVLLARSQAERNAWVRSLRQVMSRRADNAD